MTNLQKLFLKNIQTREAFFYQLRAMNPDLVHVQRNQRWSAIQICEHVLRMEQGTYSNIKTHWKMKKFVPFKSIFMSRMLIKAFNSDKKFPVPSIDSIVPQNMLTIDQVIEEWTECHNNWNTFLGEAQKSRFHTVFKHPFAGLLNMRQTLKQMNAHAKRHLKQLKSL